MAQSARQDMSMSQGAAQARKQARHPAAHSSGPPGAHLACRTCAEKTERQAALHRAALSASASQRAAAGSPGWPGSGSRPASRRSCRGATAGSTSSSATRLPSAARPLTAPAGRFSVGQLLVAPTHLGEHVGHSRDAAARAASRQLRQGHAPYWEAMDLPSPRSTSASCCVTLACRWGAASPRRLQACATSSGGTARLLSRAHPPGRAAEQAGFAAADADASWSPGSDGAAVKVQGRARWSSALCRPAGARCCCGPSCVPARAGQEPACSLVTHGPVGVQGAGPQALGDQAGHRCGHQLVQVGAHVQVGVGQQRAGHLHRRPGSADALVSRACRRPPCAA